MSGANQNQTAYRAADVLRTWKDDAGQRSALLPLPILELDAYQVRLVEKGVDGPLQPRKVAAQFPRAVRVGPVVQDDKYPVSGMEAALLRLVDV